jgi:hypothetical protein
MLDRRKAKKLDPRVDLPPKWWTPKRAKLVYNTTIGGKACEN